MALKKEVTFMNSAMQQITGEYWRIERIHQHRGVGVELIPPIVLLELWPDQESRDNHALGDLPLWSNMIPTGVDPNDYTLQDIYEWLKSNHPMLTGAIDV